MLGRAALKQGLWVAYGVLLLGAIWLVLTASGKSGEWAKDLSVHLPPLLTLTAALAVPILAAMCSLHLRIDWRLRIALLVVLLACVPLLPVAFESHPTTVAVIGVIFVVEEFGIIPLVNRWLIARTNRL
jgi:cytochrome bd-type quinol oxidase subunit 2